jgi:beta-aspartyl-peptidase (threonine type)
MKYQEIGLKDAARETIEYLTRIGGEGGLIAVDARGNITMPFNSEGMYRGCVKEDGEFITAIYRD